MKKLIGMLLIAAVTITSNPVKAALKKETKKTFLKLNFDHTRKDDQGNETTTVKLEIHEILGAYGKEQIDGNYNPLSDFYIKTGRSFSSKLLKKSADFWLKNVKTVENVDIAYGTGTGSYNGSFIIERGDSVIITEEKSGLKFIGNNAKKYELQYNLHLIEQSKSISTKPINASSLFNYYQNVDSLSQVSQGLLNSFKGQISGNIYWLIKAKIITSFQLLKITACQNLISQLRNDSEKILIYDYLKKYHDPNLNNKIRMTFSSHFYINHYLFYLTCLLKQYEFENSLAMNKSIDIKSTYNHFIRGFSGSIREWLLYSLTRDMANKPGFILSQCINVIVNNKYVTNKFMLQYFQTLLNGNTPGNLAFDFALPDTLGKIVKQADLKGKIVLIDTWHYSCGACATLHPILDSVKSVINSKDFVVVSIFRDFGEGKQKWLARIKTGIYTNNKNMNLFLTDKSEKNADNTPFSRHYQLVGDPNIILVDKNGEIMEHPVWPGSDNGSNLIKLIKEKL